MRVLSIGNSFSDDAHAYLHALAASEGKELETVNLYIGGCSLHRHAENLKTGEKVYETRINGVGEELHSIQDLVENGSWDVVTFQQASHHSGKPETYFPYLMELSAYVKEKCPQAKQLLQMTWAYEVDSTHPSFPDYHCDQREMYEKLKEAYEEASRKCSMPIIPVGTVIQRLREEVPAFRVKEGGVSLNRDGFHLSFSYGRYAAAATWYQFLLGGGYSEQSFVPSVEGGISMDRIREIRDMAEKVCREMGGKPWNG